MEDGAVRDERDAVLAEQTGRFEGNKSTHGLCSERRGRSNGTSLHEIPFQHDACSPDNAPRFARQPGDGIAQIVRGRPGCASDPVDSVSGRQDCAHRTLGDAHP